MDWGLYGPRGCCWVRPDGAGSLRDTFSGAPTVGVGVALGELAFPNEVFRAPDPAGVG